MIIRFKINDLRSPAHSATHKPTHKPMPETKKKSIDYRVRYWNMRPCTTKFGLWLREQRLSRRWTQRELSLQSGATMVDLNRYERGYRHPDEHSVRRLCNTFNCSFSEVWKIRNESIEYRHAAGIEGMHRIQASQDIPKIRDVHTRPQQLMNLIPAARHDEATIEYKVRVRLDILKDVIEEAEKYNITAPQMLAIGIQNYFSEQKRLGSFAPVEDLIEEEKARISKIKRKASRLGNIAIREKKAKAREVEL